MSDEPTPDPDGDSSGRISLPPMARVMDGTDYLMHMLEAVSALVFALLFGLGLYDLIILIVQAIRSGSIADPAQVVTFVDRGLLLFIIAEVYQTVVAYVRKQPSRTILRLVIFTGVIAIVRKVIVFRTSTYNTSIEALLVAVTYGVLLVTLAVLMFAERQVLTMDGE